MNSSPKIRIFISSTFLDMQKERDILNQDIFPIIKGECDKLGVPFSVIDLRWGITEEDQSKGNVVDLCLEEIKHCKPYFIGLVGNRYGWCPGHYDDELKDKYGFISDNEDKSVTELEMILGAINAVNKSRCFFYYKDSSLFEDFTSDNKEADIENLKQKINENGVNHTTYYTFDEFKEAVIKDLLAAIHEDYPSSDAVPELKQKTFLALQSASFVSRLFMTSQVIDIISYGENNHIPVIAYSPERLGKTMLFNRVISSKKDADKIIINLQADKTMQYFPWYYLYRELIDGLDSLEIKIYGNDTLPEPNGVLSVEAYYQARLGLLCDYLYSLELNRPLYILINDIDLIFDNDDSCTFLRHFFVSKEELPDNLYVFLTSCNKSQLQAGKFNVAEMHSNSLENPKEFFAAYLNNFAKKIDIDILDTANPNLTFVDYKYIADYLIYYCNFASYKDTAKALLSKANKDEILKYIYQDSISRLSPKCASVFSEILIRLAVFEPGFSESMLFASYDKKTAIEELKEHQVYVDLSEIEKAMIMRPLRYFSDVESGIIYISDRGIKGFLKNNINELWKVIASTYLERSVEAANRLFEEADFVSKYGKQYNKEEYLELLQTNSEMHQKIEYAIFDPLCAYLDKVIMDFIKNEISDERIGFASLCDQDFYMLTMIQEAAKLYKINTRADLYQKIISNKRLMYFIESRSHSLIRRLIKGYIDLNIDLQKKQYSKVDMNSLSFTINYALENIYSKIEEDEDLLFIQKQVISNIALILRENYILDGKLLNLVDSDGFASEEIFEKFIFTCCSSEVIDLTYDIDYELANEEENDFLLDRYNECAEGYDSSISVFDKIIYAYNIFLLAFYLADQAYMNDDEYQILSHVCESIEEHLRYCYFPEVFAMFDMFFGRLFPNNILFRIMAGINVLKYQGFNDIYSSYQEAYDYFKKNQ